VGLRNRCEQQRQAFRFDDDRDDDDAAKPAKATPVSLLSTGVTTKREGDGSGNAAGVDANAKDS